MITADTVKNAIRERWSTVILIKCKLTNEAKCSIYCRTMHMHKRGYSRQAVSVRLSHLWVLTKRVNIFSNFFHCRVAKPF